MSERRSYVSTEVVIDLAERLAAGEITDDEAQQLLERFSVEVGGDG